MSKDLIYVHVAPATHELPHVSSSACFADRNQSSHKIRSSGPRECHAGWSEWDGVRGRWCSPELVTGEPLHSACNDRSLREEVESFSVLVHLFKW